ncbi:MAG TPA: hypothetical protein VFG21_06595 [Xanthomonadaceae bacterium]|nr:hypothetical protein [Xanthomonadaceae bacterium]
MRGWLLRGGASCGRLPPGEPMAVDWVDIEAPDQGVLAGTARGVQLQGFAAGAACFTRLEGIFAGRDEIFFTSTDGSPAACGQVFVYRPDRFTGDFRGSEWAGACFSPDGRWLFANIYSPGFSVAITGPWREDLI